MKKVTMFKFGRKTCLKHKNGSLSTLRMQNQFRPRDWTRTLDSKSRDLSSLSQRCGWTELLSALEHQTLSSGPWEKQTKDSNSSWMIRLKPLCQINGKIDLSPSRATVTRTTSTWQPLMLDGSNFSDGKTTCLSTTKERSWQSLEISTEKTETLVSTTRMENSVKLGILSMLIKCQMVSIKL